MFGISSDVYFKRKLVCWFWTCVKSHKTNTTKSIFFSVNTKTADGLTPVVRPLHVCLNKTFKGSIHGE